jgi:hypothetical protein
MTKNTHEAEFLNERFLFTATFKRNSKIVVEQVVEELTIEYHKYGDSIDYLVAYFEMKLYNQNSSLLKMYENKDFDSMSVTMVDKQTKMRTRRPLNVKIKYLMGDKTKKKGMMLCGKCLYAIKNEDLSNLEWYIRIHEAMGYEKVYICNQMSEKADAFRRLVYKYKSLLQVETIKCIPNLQPHAYLENVTYLKYPNDLTTGIVGQFYRDKYFAFEYLSVNECYNDNIDKYRHIAVYDADEFVLAKKIKNFTTFSSVRKLILGINYGKVGTQNLFAQIKCDQNVDIESFIDKDLKPKLNTSGEEVSLHFKYGSYLRNEIMDEIFKSLKSNLEFLIVESLKADKLTKLTIDVIKEERFKDLKLEGPVSLTINGLKELRYALSLLKLHDEFVKPFFENHTFEFKSKAGKFNRLFFLSGDLNYPLIGKSILNTRRSMDVFIHYGFGSMNIDANGGSVQVVHGEGNIADWRINNRDLEVPQELAHVSHYRNKLEFHPRFVSISSLHFDLNYFKCYLIPMLEGR